MRIQKYLSQQGVASRRKAEELVAMGKVYINGAKAAIGAAIDPSTDIITVNGNKVEPRTAHVYWAMHKPRGVVTTVTDPLGRKTIIDLIKAPPKGIHPVGRLDMNTSGLIFLTTDGAFTQSLSHPRHSIDKTYIAKTDKPIDDSVIAAFAAGMLIDGYKTRAAKLSIVSQDRQSCKIILKEGRNRQIRKMMEALGYNVMSLRRVSIGKIELGDLKPGTHRPLTAEEIRGLLGKEK